MAFDPGAQLTANAIMVSSNDGMPQSQLSKLHQVSVE